MVRGRLLARPTLCDVKPPFPTSGSRYSQVRRQPRSPPWPSCRCCRIPFFCEETAFTGTKYSFSRVAFCEALKRQKRDYGAPGSATSHYAERSF